tara:strand:- start:122 stop:571 length:450 start_codon:yes stop_codon:yes gene_type:complete
MKKKDNLEKSARILYLIFSITIISYLFLFDIFSKTFNYKYSFINEVVSLNLSYAIFPPKPGYMCGLKVVDYKNYKKCEKEYRQTEFKMRVLNGKLVYLPEPKEFDANYIIRKDFIEPYTTFILFFLSLYLMWRYRFKVTNKILQFYKKI